MVNGEFDVSKKSTKNIGFALALNLIFFAIEILGGVLTHSMAVISDVIHDSGDLVAIGISWFAEKVSEKRPNERYTYGYGRFSFLGALVNSLILLASSAVILQHAIPRLLAPVAVDHDGMVGLALLGLLFKGSAVLKTAKKRGIGERVVNLHLMLDVLNWAGVLVVGVLIKIFNVMILDPLLSLGIVAFVIVNVFRNFKVIFEVLLEMAPRNVNMQALQGAILEHENIVSIHHIHIWLADGVNPYSTLHVVVRDGLEDLEFSEVKKYVKKVMENNHIGHVTVEIEFECEHCQEDNCEFEMQGFVPHLHHHHGHHHD
ncbi:MAG: cation diffusion facilitator family transporter [Oscillospiraceae bacterium]|jgi:cobalt-zinc-cadmium efflux system protein|nr:cation diffusion facilitator family transporter [Oscillospiraceae bacterium]